MLTLLHYLLIPVWIKCLVKRLQLFKTNTWYISLYHFSKLYCDDILLARTINNIFETLQKQSTKTMKVKLMSSIQRVSSNWCLLSCVGESCECSDISHPTITQVHTISLYTVEILTLPPLWLVTVSIRAYFGVSV